MTSWWNDIPSMMILSNIVKTETGEQENRQMVSPFYRFCSCHFSMKVICSATEMNSLCFFIKNHRGEQPDGNREGVTVAMC